MRKFFPRPHLIKEEPNQEDNIVKNINTALAAFVTGCLFAATLQAEDEKV